MKSVGFIGKMDKTELIQYVAKVISSFDKKTIFIDATTSQKTRYAVPALPGMEGQGQYVVEHDGVDVAVGFNNILELKKFLLGKGEDFNNYDYVLIDIDSDEMCEEYDMKNANNLFFVTSFDKMHILKGIELLKYICATKRREDTSAKIDLMKVLYYSELNTADTKYINSLTEDLPINWINESVNIMYNGLDLSVNIQNQYSTKIGLKNLSQELKAGIMDIVSVITGEDKNRIKKTIKTIERIR